MERTIDDAVNAWMERIRKLDDAEYIRQTATEDRHYIIFNCGSMYGVGSHLKLEPFSYNSYRNSEPAGYSFPQSVAIEDIKPTKAERKIMLKYGVKYSMKQSKDVVSKRHFGVKQDYFESDSADSSNE